MPEHAYRPILSLGHLQRRQRENVYDMIYMSLAMSVSIYF